MAARKGLEPLTFALGKRCSILLSYRAALRAPGCIAQVSRRANPGRKRGHGGDGGRVRWRGRAGKGLRDRDRLSRTPAQGSGAPRLEVVEDLAVGRAPDAAGASPVAACDEPVSYTHLTLPTKA